MYVKYYSLSDDQYRLFKLVRWRALLATATFVVMLMAATQLLGFPYGLEPTGWPFSPVDWYGWILSLLLALTAWPALTLVFALERLYVNWKVRQNSPGISAVAYPMIVLIFGLLLFSLILIGRLAYLAAWVVPSSGWPSGMVWSQGCRERILQVGFSPDGTLIHARLKSGEVRSWRLGRGKESTIEYGPDTKMGPVSTPPFPEADNGTMTLSAGTTVLEFKREANKIKALAGPGEKERMLTGASGVLCVALSSDGLLALSASKNGVVRMWDLQKNLEKSEMSGDPVGLHLDTANAVACSGDKNLVISAGRDKKDNKVAVWSVTSKKLVRGFESGHKSPVKQVALNADGKRAASASDDGGNGDLRIWDVDSGKLLGQYEWRTAPLEHLSLSPDGRFALTTDAENLQLWRLPTGP